MNPTAILLGSARSDGNTRKVVDYIRQQIAADFFDLNDYQIGYYDYQYGQNDDFLPLMEQLVHYHHLILATPVYWYNMSAQMKTFFDRLTDVMNIRQDLHALWQGHTILALSCGPDDDVPSFFYEPFSATAAYLGLQFGGGVHTWLEEGKLSPDRQSAVNSWLGNI
jgi:hypothetical protein